LYKKNFSTAQKVQNISVMDVICLMDVPGNSRCWREPLGTQRSNCQPVSCL